MNASPATINIAQHFLDTVQKRKDQPLAWEKRRNIYQSLSWKEIAARANLLTRSLSAMGLHKHERVVNYLPNSPSCMVLDIACMALGATSVNLSEKFTVDEAFSAIVECQAKFVFITSESLGAKLISEENGQCKNIESIIIPETVRLTSKERIKVESWSTVMEKGKTEHDKLALLIRAAQPKDTIALLYTHGQDNSLLALKRSHADVLRLCEVMIKSHEVKPPSSSDMFLVTVPHGHRCGYHAGHLLPIILEAQIAYADAFNTDDMSFQAVAPTIVVGTSDYFRELKKFTIEQIKRSGGVDNFALDQTLKLGKIKYETPGGLSLTQKMMEASLKPVVINRIRNQFGGKLNSIISVDNTMDYETQLFFYSFGIDFIEAGDEL